MSLKPPKKSDMGKNWMKPRRDKSILLRPEYHLIVTEGTATEPQYFEAVRDIINRQYRDKIQLDVYGEGNNACTCKSQCAIFGNMSDIHPVNNTVKYIDKLRGHRRDGKLEHQSAYGCLAKIGCCVHFNFPHPFDRDCRTCMCSSPCILIIVNFNRYGQKKL